MEIKNVITMLMAQDMDRAVKFYRDALGFSVQFQSSGWTQMTFDNSTVALRSCPRRRIQYKDHNAANQGSGRSPPYLYGLRKTGLSE